MHKMSIVQTESNQLLIFINKKVNHVIGLLFPVVSFPNIRLSSLKVETYIGLTVFASQNLNSWGHRKQ